MFLTQDYWIRNKNNMPSTIFKETFHRHKWSIDAELIPSNEHLKSIGIDHMQRIFAYCSCGAHIYDDEIVEILNAHSEHIEIPKYGHYSRL